MNMLIDIDAALAERLERVAPAKSRKRSEFVREAIKKAVLEAEESRTREAYARAPDSSELILDAAGSWSKEGWPDSGADRKKSKSASKKPGRKLKARP